jgi:hypothetical protein
MMLIRHVRHLALVPLVMLALASGELCAQATESDIAPFNGFDVSNSSVSTLAIQRGGPPKDGIPAIDGPKFVAAAQSGLADADRVLGVALNGIARAYPVRILNWHEVVNDRFGERAIAVTYCPLCGTGMAFEAGSAAQALALACRGCSTTAMCCYTTARRSRCGRRSRKRQSAGR